MDEMVDLTAATEAAWRRFRGRLADHVAAMTDKDVLVVECESVLDEEDDDPDGAGAVPYVQLLAFGDDRVRAEAVSNHYLHPELALTREQQEQMLALGWEEPGDEPGTENYGVVCERREADRVAVLLVRTLHEVFAVPHPAFLDAGRLAVDGPAAGGLDPGAAAATGEDPDEGPEEFTALPRGRAHLRDLVDEALEPVLSTLEHDEDGDVPIVAGRSLVYVRVRGDRPAVQLYAEIVLEPADADRLLVELALLNRQHPRWQFVEHDGVVIMREELAALPFSSLHLRCALHAFLADVDRIAADLVARVGGRRLLDDGEDERDEDDVREPECDPAMLGLLELLHLDRVRPSTVAGLFDHDRLAIIGHLVGVRTGRESCGEHDEETVLTALRQALRVVSDGRTDDDRPRRLPPRPRSIQQSLINDEDAGEDSLDLGWPA